MVLRGRVWDFGGGGIRGICCVLHRRWGQGRVAPLSCQEDRWAGVVSNAVVRVILELFGGDVSLLEGDAETPVFGSCLQLAC